MEDSGTALKATRPKLEVLSCTRDICRDFLRNVCHRESRCKYKHLTSDDLLALVDVEADSGSSNVTYEFCHDFQNQGCNRHNCKFIHCPADVEKAFHERRVLPLRLKYEFELGVQELFVAPLNQEVSTNAQDKARPVCRDYMQKQCRRGKKCRFVHIDQSTGVPSDENECHRDHISAGTKLHQLENMDSQDSVKRMRLYGEYISDRNQSFTKHAVQFIKEENMMLRKEVADLRKQVSGLCATNEVLLEQNAQFRMHKHQLVEQGAAFSQNAKTFENRSTMSVSVPIAMSLSLPRATQPLSNTGLAGATLIASDPLSQETAPTVSVRTHAAVPAQAHIQFPQSGTAIMKTINPTNNQLVDDLQTLTNHQANAPQNQTIHTGVPILPQVSLTGPNFSINQTSVPLTEVHSITAITTSTSGTILRDNTLVNGALTPQNAMTINGPQKVVAGGMVGQASCGISLDADTKSIGCVNHNMATLVTANQQDPSAAQPPPPNLSASIAAVAAQVIAAHAQPSSEIGTAQISLPTVPCVTLAPTIVPVTLTTSLPVARMVSSLPLVNTSNGLIATQIGGVNPSRTSARVSMVNTCLGSVNSLSLNAPHQVISTVNGRRVVSSQQQISAPINFTINPVPQAQSGIHS